MASIKTRGTPFAEINVTPFVDVVLVLLVIFMVTAPLMFEKVEVKLPRTHGAGGSASLRKSIVISLTQDGGYYMGKKKYFKEELLTQLKKQHISSAVFINADKTLNYGYVVSFLSFLNNSGIKNVSLLTEVAP